MATDITMPKLSDTMTEGTFGTWKKGIGDKVQRGDVIAEVETDKAVMDLEAFSSGILIEQRVHAGEVVQVGAVIGLIGQPGEETGATEQAEEQIEKKGEEPAGNHKEAKEKEQKEEQKEKKAQEQAEERAEGQKEEKEPKEEKTNKQTEKRAEGQAVKQPAEQAAPVVRRRAREMEIDLSLVDGSGPGGRVLLEDLERVTDLSNEPVPGPAAETEAPLPASPESEEGGRVRSVAPPFAGEQRLSKMRAAIARSVDKAWREIPHFSVSVEVDMEAAREIRRELKGSGTPVSINDMVIKASALALKEFPLVNAAFGGDRIVMHDEINIGIAVSLEEGLLVPVLRGCDHMALAEIALNSDRLIKRARSGQLSEAELSGGTFSISNMGMYGVTSFTAIIHPSQGAILAVGALRDAVIAKNGQPTVGRIMNLTLSADHRLLDGAYAARFLKELKHTMENPVRLLI